MLKPGYAVEYDTVRRTRSTPPARPSSSTGSISRGRSTAPAAEEAGAVAGRRRERARRSGERRPLAARGLHRRDDGRPVTRTSRAVPDVHESGGDRLRLRYDNADEPPTRAAASWGSSTTSGGAAGSSDQTGWNGCGRRSTRSGTTVTLSELASVRTSMPRSSVVTCPARSAGPTPGGRRSRPQRSAVRGVREAGGCRDPKAGGGGACGDPDGPRPGVDRRAAARRSRC